MGMNSPNDISGDDMRENDDPGTHTASGVYAALGTPRRPQSREADAGALLDYLDLVVQAGVDGLVLFGSTGEFIHFDTDERMRVIALAIRRSRVPVLVNVSHSTLDGAIELTENAVGAGAAGVLLMPPYYYQYTDNQLRSFFHHFVKEVDKETPRYLYNIPSCTSPISPELACELLQSEAFTGIKDSSLNPSLFSALVALRARHPFRFLMGHEAWHLKGREAGADGVVSGVSAALPELPVAIDRAIRNGKLGQAEVLHARMAELLVWLDKFPGTVAIKQCAAHRGWPLGHFAFPFDEQTDRELTVFRNWLDDWLPVVLAECA